MGLGRSEETEAVDHRVGHEVGVSVSRAPVFVVVVPLSLLDVLSQGHGDIGRRVVTVALDDVGHVVAHHAAEPAALIALVCDVVTHVGRSRDAERQRV